jgi:hypothetical protein
VNILGVSGAVANCHEGVDGVDGLAIAVAAGWVGLDHGSFFLFRIERVGEDALAIGSLGLCDLLVMIFTAVLLPVETEEGEVSLAQSDLVILLEFVPDLMSRYYLTERITIVCLLIVVDQEVALTLLYLQERQAVFHRHFAVLGLGVHEDQIVSD